MTRLVFLSFFRGFIAILLFLCGVSIGLAQSSPPDQISILPDRQSNVRLVTFNDADEVDGSQSTVKAEYVSNGLRLSYHIEKYGGIVLKDGGVNTDRIANLRLRLWQIEGKPPKAKLQFTSKSGARASFPIDILALPESGERPERVISLDRFAALNADLLEETQQIALVLLQGDGVVEIESISIESGKKIDRSAQPPYPSKSVLSLPKGLGAWCYGSSAFIARDIANYNASTPSPNKIRYLFPHAAAIGMTKEGRLVVHWMDKQLSSLRQALDESGNADVLLLPMIDGGTTNAGKVPQEEWMRVAKEIGAFVEKNPALYGVHFDLEPHDAHVYFLFSYLRSYTHKLITAAVGYSTADLFRYTDMAVLMAYDKADRPDKYTINAARKVNPFLRHAFEGGGHAMIGVPAIATHREMESVAESMEGPRKVTGYQMAQFVQAAIGMTEKFLKEDPHFQTPFIGFSIWAIHEQPALHGPSDTLYYFPGHISPAVWKYFSEWKEPAVSNEQ